ncbi:MAG: phosphatase PAP2 family protein [Sulfuricurvum sp.]|jgi:membrane-associated PAP2 superfamily phosphatase|uniref:phosphatase PAP2 family protein n=1 Tax=Sulfuricurvum sp. TaxID=2025608 RepID=UPI0026011F8D|nr:phosphatase PAP2 family protein [Sulfuricurvum sp.]MCK9374028.1 phosphatase PAP2 family protein [Sulfuricurvum sp.]
MASAKQLWLSAVILVGTILFFGITDVDVWVQSHFYDPSTHQWIVDTDNSVLKFVFYDGIKRLLILVAVVLFVLTVIRWKHPGFKRYRRGMLIVLLSSVLVPFIVGSLKAFTNIPCPKNLEIFDGTYPHTCVWEKYPSDFCQKEKMKCWPAGHASGGFALLSLVFLFRSRKNKILSASAAIVIGWSMGSYKMLIGDHFLSHTAITMVLAWFLILLIAQGVERLGKRFVSISL